MSTLIYPEQPDDAQLWRMVGFSLALHALVVMIYLSLSHIELPKMPERLEIELFSVKSHPPSPAPAVEMPTPVEPPKPAPPVVNPSPVVKPQTPVETPKPVLAAPDNHQADYRVPEPPAPAKVETAPVAPAASAPQTSAAAESAPHATNETSKESRPNVAANQTASQESDEINDSDSDAWGDYGQQLRSLVNKSKQYPAIAIRRHLEGEAIVVAQFVRGELVNVSLADSSKHVPLDEEAMRMVKKAIAQLGVKDSLKKKSFKITIPVSFKLE